jgi:hypothetical protein
MNRSPPAKEYGPSFNPNFCLATILQGRVQNPPLLIVEVLLRIDITRLNPHQPEGARPSVSHDSSFSKIGRIFVFQ